MVKPTFESDSEAAQSYLTFATPWTVAYQAPPSMGFSRQEYWSGLSFPSPGYLPNLGIGHGSPVLWADALPSEPPGKQKSTFRNTQNTVWHFGTERIWSNLPLT